jgi:glycosyltransferase involved in cell wall biosynthesis
MKNIVLVSYSYWPSHFGGELLASIERLEELSRRGHRITVLTSGIPGLSRREINNGIEILRSPIVHSSRLGRALRRLIFIAWARGMLAKMEVDVVHLTGTGGIGPLSTNLGSAWLARVARQVGARSFWVHSLADSEGSAFLTQGYEFRLRKFFLEQVDTIVSVSPGLHQGVSGVFPGKAVCIPYGVHDEHFRPLEDGERAQARSGLETAEGDLVFVFLGSVTRRKGFDLLAQAFASLSGAHPNWRLWVVGPRTRHENQNIDPQEVEETCKPLEGCGSVRYWGRVDDRSRLRELLSMADIFVFPTRKEGMPLSPIEAMSCGVPVIISHLPGVTDVACVDGETGLFVRPGDRVSLESAMQVLGDDPELRRRMGEAGIRRVRAGFGWQQYIDRWERVYSGHKD